MKYNFSIVIDADTLKEKLEEAIKKNPKIHVEIIKSFSAALMLALGLNDKDNVSVQYFGAMRLPEDWKPPASEKPKETKSEDEKNWGKPGAYVSGS